MKTLAAVLVEHQKPIELAELEIPPLKPGQVLVEVAYSGVCQTQVGEWLGLRGPDPFLPHCFGHEASGRVIEIGSGVQRCREGDAVILSWIKATGADVPGTTYRWGTRTVNAGGVTTFARHAVVSENRVTVTPSDLSTRAAALVGCAVATGFGSVLNTARLQPGQSVAVFGVGGIGLCAVSAASIHRAGPIIGLDARPMRLEAARKLGATHLVDVSREDAVARIKEICPAGVDVVIEATGKAPVMQSALAVARRQGGCAVVVGNAPYGENLVLDPREFNQGKRLLGTWGGDTVPDRDFPQYCSWIASGKAPLETLFDREYSLSQVTQALEDLRNGNCIRPLINLSLDVV